MPSLTSPFRRAGRVLADHARRLQTALEALAVQVRAAIAKVVGQATGDAVRDALGVILDGPTARPGDHDPPEERERTWGQPRRTHWPGHAYDPYARDPYGRDPYDRDPDEERDPERDRYNASREETSEGHEPAGPEQQGVWSRAMATGCQAAGWWLRRHPGRFSVIAALGVGVAAGVAALVGGPFVAGGSALAASALGLLALADAARCAATFAADAADGVT